MYFAYEICVQNRYKIQNMEICAMTLHHGDNKKTTFLSNKQVLRKVDLLVNIKT